MVKRKPAASETHEPQESPDTENEQETPQEEKSLDDYPSEEEQSPVDEPVQEADANVEILTVEHSSTDVYVAGEDIEKTLDKYNNQQA